MTKPRSLSEYARAMLRRALAFSETAPAVFTNENVRGLLGADETSMSCPRCGNAAQGRVDSSSAKSSDATNAATALRRVRERETCHAYKQREHEHPSFNKPAAAHSRRRSRRP